MVFQNVGNYLPSIMGSYDTRMEFSTTPLLKPQNCMFYYPSGAITYMDRWVVLARDSVEQHVSVMLSVPYNGAWLVLYNDKTYKFFHLKETHLFHAQKSSQASSLGPFDLCVTSWNMSKIPPHKIACHSDRGSVLVL